MTKKIKSVALFLFITYITPVQAGIRDIFPDNLEKDVLWFLNITIKTVLGFAGALAVWFLIVGGAQYISSAGNPEAIGKAKNTILYAILGLIVAIIAYAIVNFIMGSLGI